MQAFKDKYVPRWEEHRYELERERLHEERERRVVWFALGVLLLLAAVVVLALLRGPGVEPTGPEPPAPAASTAPSAAPAPAPTTTDIAAPTDGGGADKPPNAEPPR